jgi:hypothetical protein
MAGSATIVGPVAVEGAFGCGSGCATVDACPCLCDACSAVGPCAAMLRDSATEDVTVDQAADAPSTTDGNVDGGDTGAPEPDGHEDTPPRGVTEE